MRGSRFTVDDALEQYAIIIKLLTSASSSETIAEHWQAIGALGVILGDLRDQQEEDCDVRKD